MKKRIIFLLFGILFSCHAQRKNLLPQNKQAIHQECYCDKDIAMDRTTRHIVLTHIRLRKEGNDYFIQGNCCDILRAYVQSEKGEYEEESVQCISDEIQEFRLTNNIQYSLSYKGKGEQFILTKKWEEAKPFFLSKELQREDVFIEVGVSNENNSLLWVYTRNYNYKK